MQWAHHEQTPAGVAIAPLSRCDADATSDISARLTEDRRHHVPRDRPQTAVRPILVIASFTTATVMPDEGTIHFAEGIYRDGAKLRQ